MKRSLRLLLLCILGLVLTVATTPAWSQEGTLATSADPPTSGEESTTEDAGTSEDDEADEEPEEDRISFNVKIAEEDGGGRVTGKASDFKLQDGEYLLATGGIELKYKSLKLKADTARIDLETSLLTAEGNVTLDDGPERLTGHSLEYDLETQTGKVTEATAYVAPDYYFSGRQIAKVGDQTFSVVDGIFTSCEQEVPSWSITLKSARITVEEYARIHHAKLKFKKVPVLYLPYIVWPATTERTSGFLVPKPGYSNRRGASLDLAYYKVLGRSADTTFFFDVSSESYLGFGNETRWRPSETSEGYLRAYFLSEPDDAWADEPGRNPFDADLRDELGQPIGADRWKVELFHKSTELWEHFSFVADIQEYSDLDYLQDYERNANRQARSFIYSKAFLSGNFGAGSFNVLVDQRERILRNSNDVRRQLPEVEYKLRSTQLGSSLVYFSLESSAHNIALDIDTGTFNIDDDYTRFNVQPTFSIPLSQLSWLSAKLDLGGRATYYSESLKEREFVPLADGTQRQLPREFGGGSLDRVVPTASLELVGPVFSKIFDTGGERYSKIKHIIEPRVTYSYVDDFLDDPVLLDDGTMSEVDPDPFLFDEVDTLVPTNGYTVSLINRLKAKPRDEEAGGSTEIASFELRQTFSLDDDKLLQTDPTGELEGLKEGPLRATLRINPTQRSSFKADATYSTLFSDLSSLSFTAERWFGGGPEVKGLGEHKLGLTYFNTQNARTGVTTSDQVRLFTKFALLPKRLTLDAVVSYDIENDEILQQRYFLNWDSQCYSWQLELRESKLGDIEDTDLRFALTLKNVGTFLDLNESL